MNPVRYFFPRRLWIAAVCALALTGCDQLVKNDPTSAMNDFFALMAKQHYQEAYDSASLPFRTQLSEASFEAIARDLKLGDFNSITWTPEAAATEKEARLKGEFASKNNQTLLLSVTVILESGRWKLYSMRTPAPNTPSVYVDMFSLFNRGIGFNDAFTRAIPDDNEVRALVTETMLKFNECLHKKKFQPFYEDTSALWQSQTTPDMVSRAFKPFIDAGITLDFIKDTKIIFDEPPRLTSAGYLQVAGYYPTVPDHVVFTLKYVFELPKWKLLGITVNVKP